MIIQSDGQLFSITRNDIYKNHSEYLQQLTKNNPELLPYCFGLVFKPDDNTAKELFFKELALDNAIIFENLKIFSKENISSISIYLPDGITLEEKDVLDLLMNQIEQIKCVFLEGYQDETEKFYDLYQKKEDLANGANILREYMSNHVIQKEKR